MTQLTIDPDVLSERVEAGLKRQKKATRIILTVVSFGLFILFNLIAWAIALKTGTTVVDGATSDPQGGIIGGMAMMTAGWFVTLIYLVILGVLDTEISEKGMRARLTARIMGEMVQESLVGSSEKPKRKRRNPDDLGASLTEDEPMTLGDDGELITERESQRQTRR